ncbi:iap3 [Lambdina fiscellaria nucleopolyhedrovirus]|uniref:Iap3 n=1 Tax=Lambdina fiscellaria nucleopolyhedrovirus TaxID=1642929 RepID=A0A0E3Z7D8_9ABAC|nr:iap3 [Lambdina fiscellaria nucleopolyhedrovirus]AKC91668.1 iap3 [Lambdina fiscellaria nucleopolyhedrovirus]
MYSKSQRLASFASWPLNHLTAADMAYAGFYYLGRSTLVRCAYCCVVIDDWPLGTDAMSHHKRRSPKCQFVARLICKPVELDLLEDVQKQTLESAPCAAKATAMSLSSTFKNDKENNEENKDDDKHDKNYNANRCAVCLDNEREIAFVPCCHVVCCFSCTKMLNECVVCKQVIERAVRVYLH